MLEISIKSYLELSKEELYEILRLRSEVFVVEQDCVYQDIDDKDQKALHILGFKSNHLVAYTRCFQAGDYFNEASIGRVVVKEKQRKFGYGHTIIKVSIQAIEDQFHTKTVKISAQEYLKNFYESHGFKQIGETYLEDGIPHIAMIKN